jgi:hypothetical protein
MGVDIEINDGKSHFNRPFEVSGKRTGISPFLEELIITMDPFFDLSQVSLSPHLSKKIPLEVLEVLPLLKIAAILDGSDPEREFRKSLAISIRDSEGDLFLHGSSSILRSYL